MKKYTFICIFYSVLSKGEFYGQTSFERLQECANIYKKVEVHFIKTLHIFEKKRDREIVALEASIPQLGEIRTSLGYSYSLPQGLPHCSLLNRWIFPSSLEFSDKEQYINFLASLKKNGNSRLHLFLRTVFQDADRRSSGYPVRRNFPTVLMRISEIPEKYGLTHHSSTLSQEKKRSYFDNLFQENCPKASAGKMGLTVWLDFSFDFMKSFS